MGGYYYVYMMTNKNKSVLYTGVTGDLPKRVWEHKEGGGKGFCARYGLNRLVWYEVYEDPEAAITREKRIKGGSRRSKEKLIHGMNREWRDLSEDM